MSRGTLIVQSAPPGPPAWLQRCMTSIAGWCTARGHGYRRLDDTFFDVVPPHLRMRVGAAGLIQLTDLARLQWLARALDEGFARVAWIDSDILLFDPARFDLPDAPFACARELWVWAEHGALATRSNPTNALLSFTTRTGLLDWYIAAAERILAAAPLPLKRLALGPQILGDVHRLAPLPMIESVATLSPLLIAETIAGGGPALDLHRAQWPAIVAGAHLCRSLGHTGQAPALTPPDAFDPAIDRLLTDGRRLLNR